MSGLSCSVGKMPPYDDAFPRAGEDLINRGWRDMMVVRSLSSFVRGASSAAPSREKASGICFASSWWPGGFLLVGGPVARSSSLIEPASLFVISRLER